MMSGPRAQMKRHMAPLLKAGGSAPRPRASSPLRQQRELTAKPEIRNSKSETSTKDRNPKVQNGAFDLRQRFDHLDLGHWDLFRISDFDFRISPFPWSKATNLGFSGAEPLRSATWRNSLLLLCAGLALALALALGGCKRDSAGEAKKGRFEVDKVYERGPATVHVRLDKTKLTIADTVLLQFEATLEPGYRIEMPRVDKALENFGIVDWSHLGERLDAKSNVVTTYQYKLEPFLSGNYEIPAFTFVFHDVNNPAAKHELTSEPILVEVTSLLGDQRANLVIEDIEGVVEMPRPAGRWWLWIPVALGVVAAPAGWLLLRGRRARQVIRVFKSAHEVAYLRLRALVAANLVEQGRIKEFYEQISGILRHYIEDRFDLHAPDRTTEEFLGELQFTDSLAPADKLSLQEFLNHCDLVKFAKHEPTTEQIQRTFDLVKDFIERTKSEEHLVDVTDQVHAGPTDETGVA